MKTCLQEVVVFKSGQTLCSIALVKQSNVVFCSCGPVGEGGPAHPDDNLGGEL